MMQLAQNLARNCHYAVFPCRNDKRPACPHGFQDAAHDAAHIAGLWRRFPAPLIGIATGTRSGISVLDLDQKHPEAHRWWQENHLLLLPTRTFETRSGGLHLYFQHRDGVGNSQGKICRGIDTRGNGGYVVAWFAAGLGCFDQMPPRPWPSWLLEDLIRQPIPRPASAARTLNSDRQIAGIMRRLSAAREGERNAVLYWAACRCANRGMLQSQVEAVLGPIASSIGLHELEAQRTIASAQERAVA